jgi:membrane protein YdbS with pleckstrin-like domain
MEGRVNMREQPKHQIAKNAIRAWRITAGIYMVFLWLLIIAGIVVSFIFDISLLYAGIAVGIGLLFIFLFVYLIPKLRYRRWRYEIFEQEIYIQHGILIVTRTIIPMIRVQHVDTEQGPILKKFHLATVSISTAATTHAIPALREEDASHLRDRISTLARVDEDDV